MKKFIKLSFIFLITLIFVSCGAKTYQLPDLEDKNKIEILNTFSNIDQTIAIDFEYEFSTEINEEYFIRYKDNLKAGDETSFTDKINIVISKGSLSLPDLEGYNKEQIEDKFISLLRDYEGLELDLEFKYIYSENSRPNRFIEYESHQIDDKIISKETIIIVLSGPENNLPDLTGKTETQIVELFNEYKDIYENYETTLNFIYLYNDTVEPNTFVSYGNELSAGDSLVIEGELDIYIGVNEVLLPDFTNYTKEEMEDYFEEINIPANKIEYRAVVNEEVEPATFIEYSGYEAGDLYNFKTGDVLYIYHDNSVLLPDLASLNKRQITEVLNLLNLRLIDFEYTIDDKKEFDLFAGYGSGLEIGSPVRADDRIQVVLYFNTDVNTAEWTINEYELFISKYISGSYGMGIELYNGTSKAINLSDYYVAILGEGSYVATESITLEGTLEPGETYVIMNDQSSEEFLDKANLITEQMSFGASDTIQLRKTSNNTYTDTIYDVGNISPIMDGEIFVRRGFVTHGRRNFTYLEWMGYVETFSDIVGIHPNDGFDDPVFELIEDKTFQEYGMTKVRYIRAADGDTVYFESLDPRDPTSYDGNNRLRFLLVDTPETEKPGQVGEPYAIEATNFTVNMLQNASEIYIQSSKEAGISDTYGRHLGLIWANVGTVENPNWKLLNYELLKAGLGNIMISKSGRYYDHPIFGGRYLYQWAEDADNYAKENKLGLYSGVNKP